MRFICVLSYLGSQNELVTPLRCSPSLHHSATSLTCSGRQMELNDLSTYSSSSGRSRVLQVYFKKQEEFSRFVNTAVSIKERPTPLRKQIPLPKGGWRKPRKTRLEDCTPWAGAVTSRDPSVSASQLEGCALCPLRRTQDSVNPPAMKKYLVFTLAFRSGESELLLSR